MPVACLGKCYAVWGCDEIGDTVCPLSVLFSLANRVLMFPASKRCLYHRSIIFIFHFLPFSKQNIQVWNGLIAQQSNLEKSRGEHNLIFKFILFYFTEMCFFWFVCFVFYACVPIYCCCLRFSLWLPETLMQWTSMQATYYSVS